MSNCGLTDETFLTILNSIDRFSLQELEIANNPKLTIKSYSAIIDFLLDSACELKVLNLEAN